MRIRADKNVRLWCDSTNCCYYAGNATEGIVIGKTSGHTVVLDLIEEMAFAAERKTGVDV